MFTRQDNYQMAVDAEAAGNYKRAAQLYRAASLNVRGRKLASRILDEAKRVELLCN